MSETIKIFSADLDSAKASVASRSYCPKDIYKYDLYNNIFVAGTSGRIARTNTTEKSHEKGQLSTMLGQYTGENDMKEVIPDFISRKLYTYELNLNVALLQSQHTQREVLGQNNSFKQDSKISVLDKSLTVVRLAKHCIQVRHSKGFKDNPKWVLTEDHPVSDSVQDYVSNCPMYQKIDREAVVDFGTNRHNHCNREIHDCLWCPCILYFIFLFCIPAMLLMQFSDTAFQKGEDSKARQYATCSTVLYVLGLVLSIAFYATIVFWIIHFNGYQI